jgi:hypothetical protein
VWPRAVLDTVVKRKIPSSRRESNPRTPIVQPVAILAHLVNINTLLRGSESELTVLICMIRRSKTKYGS